MNTQNIGEELEHNSLNKTIAKYALPAILSGLVAALYNIIDQLFIGHIIGIDGNAATNIAFPLVTLTTAIMLLLGLGGAVNFSIALGKKELDKGKKYVGAVLVCTPLIGIFISTLTLLFLNPLLWGLGATENSFDLGQHLTIAHSQLSAKIVPQIRQIYRQSTKDYAQNLTFCETIFIEILKWKL